MPAVLEAIEPKAAQLVEALHSGGNLRRTAVLERRGFGADCIEGVPTFGLSVSSELFEIF